MAIIQLLNVSNISSDELEDWGPVPQPISDTASRLPGRIINEHPV